MNTCNTCVIGITLLFSSVYMSILKQDQDIFIRFFNLLDDKQKRIYSNIVKERLMIYMTAMFSGLVAGLIYYYQNPKQKYPICTFLAIVYLTKLGVYYFYPKSPLMLYSLTTVEQKNAWADIYTIMKKRWQISLISGLGDRV